MANNSIRGIAPATDRNVVFVVDDDASQMLRSLARMLQAVPATPVCSFSLCGNICKSRAIFDRALCVVASTSIWAMGQSIDLRHRLKAAGNSVPVIYMIWDMIRLPFARPLLQSGMPRLSHQKPFSARSS